MRRDVEAFRRLRSPEGARLLESLPPYDEGSALAVGAQARARGYDGELVAAALTQARLRARARPRLGALADPLWFTDEGLQQTTRPEVARRHARRFADAGVARVLDLCCGIGGDLLALAAAGLTVTGVDRDELTAEIARANAEELGLAELVQVECAAAEERPLHGVTALFTDPARRGAGGRAWHPQATSPPLDWVLTAMAAVPEAGAKLAPGLPHDLVPAGVEAEWVSVAGDVVECALWSGALAGSTARRATVLPAGATLTGDGSRRPETGPVGAYLHEPDGAVVRAGLVAEAAAPVEGWLVDPTIAYVCTDAPVETPFLTSYRVTDVLPFGVKRLRALLRDRGVGQVTVKKRGTAVTPEALRAQLHLRGDNDATVVLTRVAGRQTVLLVEPHRVHRER